ncbi:MAG: dCTP deaminase [archaeon]
MILSKNEILKEVSIKPFSKGNLGDASYDLTLDDVFWFFKPKDIKLKEESDFNKYTIKKRMKEITLLPGEFVLGRTKERIKLPEDVCGFLSGRSRFARFGLSVHSTAMLINPGSNNRQVFEIKNNSNNPLTLKPGLKIGQLIFVRGGKGKYRGRFSKQ